MSRAKVVLRMSNHRYLTRKEVCELYRISDVTLWRLLKRKEIPYVRIGRQYRFDAEHLFKLTEGGAE
jgi:excisionase family DNA binding protein